MARSSRAWNGPKPVPTFESPEISERLENRSIDSYRPIKVVIVGAGISGILACIRFLQKIPNLDLCIYEKNADVGGTWFENKYPGCACDIPSHTYQASFEPNKEWSSFYAPATEIHQYWKGLAEKYDCLKHIKLSQEILKAEWDENSSKWLLNVHDINGGSTYQDQCEILIQATGSLNSWKWPNINGLHSFKGKLMHSARWDDDYDYAGQRIAVIGNGSSGIQIVPSTLPKVAHIDHYMRTATWIAPGQASGQLEKLKIDAGNYTFTAKEIENFKHDADEYQTFRKDIELEVQSTHPGTVIGTPAQIGLVSHITELMKRRLTEKPELLSELIPNYPPMCRRLTPGPGYLEALTDPKVELIKTDILQVDETGIITADGQHRPVEMIVCATGFDTSYTPRFPIHGRHGLPLSDRWKDGPETYLSVATDGFPNYFICFGPNSGLGAGNLTLVFEKTAEYLAQCILKIQRDNIRAMSARQDSVQRFSSYCQEYFKGTVYSRKCRSWYKGGKEEGQITALWPGSSLHAMKVLSNPRWEDFDYEYLHDNPLGWLGDGWTENEKNDRVNVDYLDDAQVDFPTSLVVQNA